MEFWGHYTKSGLETRATQEDIKRALQRLTRTLSSLRPSWFPPLIALS
jgi:hypothetical protein